MRRHLAVCFALGILCLPCAHSEQISFSAKVMSGTAGDKSSTTTLKGNARVTTENMEIQADEIEFYGKDFRYIRATGGVAGKNTQSKMDFSCRKLTYDRKTKVSKLEGGVEFMDIENEVKATAGMVEYDQDKEIAVMQIQVTILQKDNVCTSAYAIYKKNDQILELSGNPKIVQNDDTFRAQNIELNLESQDIRLSGKVQGFVTTDNDSSSSKKSTTEGDNGGKSSIDQPKEGDGDGFSSGTGAPLSKGDDVQQQQVAGS